MVVFRIQTQRFIFILSVSNCSEWNPFFFLRRFVEKYSVILLAIGTRSFKSQEFIRRRVFYLHDDGVWPDAEAEEEAEEVPAGALARRIIEAFIGLAALELANTSSQRGFVDPASLPILRGSKVEWILTLECFLDLTYFFPLRAASALTAVLAAGGKSLRVGALYIVLALVNIDYRNQL